MRHALQPLELVGAGDGVFATSADTAEPSGLRGFLRVFGVMPEAEGGVEERRLAARLAVVLDGLTASRKQPSVTSAYCRVAYRRERANPRGGPSGCAIRLPAWP